MLVTCRNVLQLRDAFLDGELSASLTAEVHAHLLQCPACQQQVETLRAVGDVITTDRSSEPRLDDRFAERVTAALAAGRHSFDDATPLPSRRRPWRFWIGAIPAAAAILLAVLIWPTSTSDNRETFVAGVAVSGIDHVVNPALDAVNDAQRAAQSLNQLIELSVGDAREGVRARLHREGAPSTRPGSDTGVSYFDVLMQPFDDMMDALGRPNDQAARKSDIVRF